MTVVSALNLCVFSRPGLHLLTPKSTKHTVVVLILLKNTVYDITHKLKSLHRLFEANRMRIAFCRLRLGAGHHLTQALLSSFPPSLLCSAKQAHLLVSSPFS